jgi:chromate transporter
VESAINQVVSKRMAKKQQIAVDATRSALAAANLDSRPQRRMGGCLPPLVSRFPSTTINESCRVTPRNLPLSVHTYGWLSTSQMIAGLGRAETTPGPLIMVLQFVGFVAAWQNPGNLHPLVAATLGASLTTWATFLPCFMFIFLGAPRIAQLRNVTTLNAALATVTAAMVGVVLNLALWFGLHAIFPTNQSVDWFAVVSASVFFFGIHRLKWNVIPVVIASGVLGILYKLLLS